MRKLVWTIASVWMSACSNDGTGAASTETEAGSEDGSSDGSATTLTTMPGGSQSSGGTPTSTGVDSSPSDESSSGGPPGDETSGDSSSGQGGSPEPCNTFDDECDAGEKCNAYSTFGGNWDELGCFPLDPAPAAVGEACTVVGGVTSGFDNCERGALCWNVDEDTNVGSCVAYCEGTILAPTCASGVSCSQTNEVLSLCLTACDPLVQDCAGDELCVPVGDEFVCAPDSGIAQGAGEACEYINECRAGLLCVGGGLIPECPGLDNCCTPFCDVTSELSDAGCAAEVAGTECVAFFVDGEAPAGHEDVGFCVTAS